MSCRKKVELLAPAGDETALRGALNAGADAVYLAGTSFGARAYAENFTEEALLQALRDAHLCGRRIYLTANVLTRQRELPELVSFVSRLYEAGLDGVIVQDLGAAASIRQACPGLPLHASTQMSVMGPGAVRLLQQMGFCRVVPARELSLEELRVLKETGIEVETFIHGAMCYSCSGRCLMSSFLGGRSGNRGRCAGTCRLPYRILDEQGKEIPLTPSAAPSAPQAGRRREEAVSRKPKNAPRRGRAAERGKGAPDDRRRGTAGTAVGNPDSHTNPNSDRMDRDQKGREVYPLSMKDLCALPLLPELLDAGIDSFKIEGRMKKPEYAAGVTAIYRKYTDRYYDWDAQGRPGRWEIDPEDMDRLRSLYIRTDLSDGYYHERNGRDMVTIGKPGYRGADPELLREIQDRYLKDRPRTAIRGRSIIQLGWPASLSVETLPRLQPSSGIDEAGVFLRCEDPEQGYRLAAKEIQETSARTEQESSLPDMLPNQAEDETIPVSFCAEGPMPQPAQQHPLTAESIRAKLEKTGESPFRLEELDIDTDGQSFLPVSALNDLRRRALDGLQEAVLRRYGLGEYPQDFPSAFPQIMEQRATGHGRTSASRHSGTDTDLTGPMAAADSLVRMPGMGEPGSVRDNNLLQAGHSCGIPKAAESQPRPRQSRPLPGGQPLIAMVMTQGQAAAAAEAGADLLILDGPVRDDPDPILLLADQDSSFPPLLAALPPVLRNSDLPWLKEYYDKYYIKFYGFVTRNLEEVAFLTEREYDKTVIADSALYCWNRPALESLKPWCDANILPQELDRREMAETFGQELCRMILPVYGRTPLMISANCVRKTAGRCRQGESLFYHLKDRTGAVLPVFTDCHHCQNIIYNSVPTSLASCLSDEQDTLMQGAGALLLSFTTETSDETSRIVRRFRNSSVKSAAAGRNGQTAEAVSRRLSAESRPAGTSGAFTYGHYRTGAL